MIFCVLLGIKASQRKPINYNKLAAIDQSSQEKTTSFIERLRRALIKYTNLDPDDPARATILKTKFITSSALVIWKKTTKIRNGANYPYGRIVKNSIVSQYFTTGIKRQKRGH